MGKRIDPSESSGGTHGFITELGRRNVWRAAAIYVAAVWALSQGIAQLAPYVGAPDWVVRWFLVACVIGFPFWIAFAWFYAWTPQGFKREETLQHTPTLARATGRKLDFWIIGIMAVAIVLLVTNQFVLHRDATSVAERHSAKALAATLAKVPQKSIAVLPLANASGDKSQQYFSDGLSEELISALAQISGLKVIGSSSSFQFRNSKDSPAEIGAALGVANLLEGSVRHQGDVVRVSLQLIHAADGRAVWSKHYDRPYKDLFALQDAITKAVAGALAAKFSAGAQTQSDRPPSGNLEAYTAYLKTLQLQRTAQTSADFRRMIDSLETAVRLDPRYATAQAGLAIAWIAESTFASPDKRQEAVAKARAAANTALALNPDLAAVHNALGAVYQYLDDDWANAETQYRYAVTLAPKYGSYLYNLSLLLGTLGRNDEALPLIRKALDLDPLSYEYYGQYEATLVMLSRLDDAEQVANRLARVLPKFAPLAHGMLSQIAILRGDEKTALAEARQSSKLRHAREANVTLALQIGPDHKAADAALQALIAKPASDQLYGTIADAYALRKDPDQVFAWLDRAAANNEGLATNLLADPFLVPYYHDPRFVKLLHRFNLALPTTSPPASAVSAAPPATATSTN